MLIWYNPDSDAYENGIHNDFLVVSSTSTNRDRFEVVHEFEDAQKRLAYKITDRLNLAKSISGKVFA